jgi:hypothetical protein
MVLLIKLIQLACPIEKSQYFLSYPSKQIENNQLLVVNKNINVSLKSTQFTFFDTNNLDDNNDEHRYD